MSTKVAYIHLNGFGSECVIYPPAWAICMLIQVWVAKTLRWDKSMQESALFYELIWKQRSIAR